MTASINGNLNPFVINDRVKVTDKDLFCFGKIGVVKYTFDISTEVKLDSGPTIIISFNKLKKLRKPKKNVSEKTSKR